MAVIAAEQFIAGVARQCDRDMLSRESRHQVRRDLRRIGERLIIHRRQLRNDLHRRLGIDIEFGVRGAEM